MENNLKKVNLNKRPLTIVFAVICGILMLLLVVPWCRKHSFGSTYYYALQLIGAPENPLVFGESGHHESPQ